MGGKIVFSHGLPGSGKSTIAEKMVAEDPQNRLRANRDDIRTALFGESYHSKTPDKKSENKVTHVQKEIIKKALREGKTVIVDDTNLSAGRLKPLVQLAKEYKAEIDQYHVDVPVEECIRRNNLRGDQGGRRVPDFVIERMAEGAYTDGKLNDFIIGSNGDVHSVPQVTEGSKKVDEFNTVLSSRHPFQGKAIVMLDMDGTLFNNERDSVRFLNNPNKDRNFEGFYKSIVDAPVNNKVRDLVNSMRTNDNLTIIAVTGRSDDFADYLIKALDKSGAKVSGLYMKREGDNRPSSDHKRDILKKFAEQGLIVTHAIDDRKKDLDMFREAGIMTTVVTPVNVNRNDIKDSYPDPDVNTVYGSGFCIRCGSKLKNGGNIGKVCATKQNI